LTAANGKRSKIQLNAVLCWDSRDNCGCWCTLHMLLVCHRAANCTALRYDCAVI